MASSKTKVYSKTTKREHRIASIDSLSKLELKALVKLMVSDGQWLVPSNPKPYMALHRKGWVFTNPRGSMFMFPSIRYTGHEERAMRHRALYAAKLVPSVTH